ncbi:phage replisome organizer N-terminal domain-containing protein [Bacillus sp. NPDC077411]|uniref:phage replisome organizer N-terminal domain-containing protein n=1 Tax=Bacillus sp. NPDC077411 TaxID=3363947 RepID=UPI0037C5299D
MSDIKWIKLNVNMFEDEKIKLIESMPEADGILVIWIRLLAMAGKTNDTGMIYLTPEFPYTDEMLATVFNKPVNTVRLALNTLAKYKMISIDDDHYIHIQNWDKHQNIEGMEHAKKLRAARNKRYYEKKKLLEQSGEEIKMSYKTEQDVLEEEKEIDKDIEKINKYIVEIVNYLNSTCEKNYRTSTKKTRTLIKARLTENYTVSDFKKVIDIKKSHWFKDPKWDEYLRPETLFGTKFESYLNSKPKVKQGSEMTAEERLKHFEQEAAEQDDLPF